MSDSNSNRPCVVLDGVFFQFRDPSGIARVWSSLLEEWADSPFGNSLLVLDRDGAAPKFSGINYIPFRSYESRYAAEESFALEEFCRRHDAELFISTFHTAPLDTPSVVMVHDTIPERFFEHGDKWRVEKRFSTLNAAGYVAVSRNTAGDLRESYPGARRRPICIAHNGVSRNFHPLGLDDVRAFKKKYGISKPYFLCVGRRNGHKNAQLFFNSFARLKNSEEIAIVCCGGAPVLEPELKDCASGVEVHMFNLSDGDLNAAYAGALALVYPSLHEGFGLPILEAMSAGCPVITCSNSSIPEVAGEAAIFVDESDTEQMALWLAEIQKQEIRDPLIGLGLERSKLFDWAKTAEIIASFLAYMASRRQSIITQRATSSRLWRELRDYERLCEMASGRKLDVLRLPQLKSHMGHPEIAEQRFGELESAWLKALDDESATSSETADEVHGLVEMPADRAV